MTSAFSCATSSHVTWVLNCSLLSRCCQVGSQLSRRGFRTVMGRCSTALVKSFCHSFALPISMDPARNTLTPEKSMSLRSGLGGL